MICFHIYFIHSVLLLLILSSVFPKQGKTDDTSAVITLNKKREV